MATTFWLSVGYNFSCMIGRSLWIRIVASFRTAAGSSLRLGIDTLITVARDRDSERLLYFGRVIFFFIF